MPACAHRWTATQEGLQDDEDAIENKTQKKLEAVQDKLPGIVETCSSGLLTVEEDLFCPMSAVSNPSW